MAAKRAADLAAALEEDAKRTLSNWRTMNVQNLRLKCNQYELSELGTKEDLIRALLTHFESLQDESA